MTSVAISAGNLIVIMRITVPAGADVTVVTTQAGIVLHADVKFFFGAKIKYRCTFLAPPDPA